MTDEIKEISIGDNFGRRSGLHRRKISDPSFEEERRDGRERRCGKDRRSGHARRNGYDRRHDDIVDVENERRGGRERRSGYDRRGFTFL